MNYDHLIQELNRSYPIHVQQIKLHREMIGKVYFVEGKDKRYVLKLYREFKTADALQSVRILDYLQANSYPAASVLRTIHDESHLLFSHQDGWCTAVLYDYIEGDMPNGKVEAQRIGQQIGELHHIMRGYPDQLIHRTKNDYIDDYISIMHELDFHSAKILDLQQYGNDLWNRITKLPKHFCHGDLHTGNMIRNQSGEYVLFDFDDASGDYPSMDVAYMSDGTHFNQFDESMYDRTLLQYESLYSGYGKKRTLSDNEFYAVFDFIAVRHFQIISRIVRCQGLQSISNEFCDEQYGWLMKWQELCMKKQTNYTS
jgi:Ser/Thr protein kinase RdoA (MazF antagonist)